MPKKALKKKKAYQNAMYLKAKDGQMNGPNGNFGSPSSIDKMNSSMRRDYFAGYKMPGLA